MKKIIFENKSFIRSIIHKLTGAYNEDIEQEVYIKTWRNLNRYREEGKFRQWLAAITANVCRDYFRSGQYRCRQLETNNDEISDSVPAADNQEAVLDAKMRQKIILKAVDQLPAKMRKIVILVEFEDLSYEQAAQKTGLPVGTVKSRLFNAKKILSEKLNFLKGDLNDE